jgi:hypothetical protein
MTARHDRKSDDLSSGGRGAGMTPIDNPEPDISDESHEPDATTGRAPSQDREADPPEKKGRRGSNQRAAGTGRR